MWLLSFSYLDSTPGCELSPRLYRDSATACVVSCTSPACVTTFIIEHYSFPLRYLAQAERVAPPESLIRLPILVQVGRTDETTFSPAAEQNNLALSYSQEQTGTWGQGTAQQYWG